MIQSTETMTEVLVQLKLLYKGLAVSAAGAGWAEFKQGFSKVALSRAAVDY